MGESVAEATVTNWLKQVGDKIEADEAVLEVATDKVDSEVPSEVSGVLIEQLFSKDDLVEVGQTIAIIETEGENEEVTVEIEETVAPEIIEEVTKTIESVKESLAAPAIANSNSEKFFSPLVRNIAAAEGIGAEELNRIPGTGSEGRVTKNDILEYLKTRTNKSEVETVNIVDAPVSTKSAPVSVSGGDEIVEMDRMRKLIAGYMISSQQTSAHVYSFIEVDMTNIVKWREKHKNEFEKREGEKLTFTPIFMEAVAKALKDYPGMNISVDGDYIIKKKNINLGMAAALPNGNLIVPVIKNADQLNLVGMAKAVNDLGNRAKLGKLKPDETKGGTYTVTNVGSFGSVFGTPILNQPEVGILALGAIRKVPAVIETPEGDFIGIRQKMFLTHGYDHRIIDGALGGMFVKRVAEYLENFDTTRTI
ncbi:diapophytoene dehydrogenase [Flavobacterium seoulense]|uniref:Dihydrolipoamide acetyltransferase component of pyruvate dehydrogenase complex n=2 Tax=Flavobacterium seoulense TaxID=1492738 RepID=A0A066WL38_9FLAO|nr:diapophytoene dehydrogenase [Flavobacterium seoulense]